MYVENMRSLFIRQLKLFLQFQMCNLDVLTEWIALTSVQDEKMFFLYGVSFDCYFIFFNVALYCVFVHVNMFRYSSIIVW